MILYHGSSVCVPVPLTDIGNCKLDFGPGFYVTNRREQAEQWARRVCVFRESDTPLLSTYEFNETLLPSDIRCLHFEHYDQKWFDFIVSSFRGEEPWRWYDLIEGSVAHEQVIEAVKDYCSGFITAQQAIDKLSVARPTHQICIRNQAIVDRCLRFIGMETVKKYDT